MSKGLDIFSIIGSSIQSVAISYDTEQDQYSDTIGNSPSDKLNYFRRDLQIEKNYIEKQKFQWHISVFGQTQDVSRWAEIDPNDFRSVSGPLSDMMTTGTVFLSSDAGAYTVCYGFYGAGTGHISSLTNRDQSYVYVTRQLRGWMGQLNPRDKQFNRFVLPGAHDAGMWSTEGIHKIATIGGPIASYLSLIVTGFDLGPIAEQVMINLAITQKDNLPTMLQIGVRYFDYRPGKMYKGAPAVSAPDLNAQHAVIPGAGFRSDLVFMYTFLSQPQNSGEILVVNLSFSGFTDHASMDPTAAELQGEINALFFTNGVKQWGGKECLNKTYGELIDSGIRIIFLNNSEVGFNPATKLDTYDDSYKTNDPKIIVGRLGTIDSSKQGSFNSSTSKWNNSSDFTVLQLQGTASGIANVVPQMVTQSSSAASSPLMSTKALFDSHTYPWLEGNVVRTMAPQQLLVCLNDFCDNALVDLCVNLTKQRLELHVPDAG